MRKIKASQAKALPDELRHLPGEYVTTDEEDPDRIHPLDPPHIVEALTNELREKEEGPREGKEVETQQDAREKRRRLCKPGRYVSMTHLTKEQIQYEVDLLRLGAIAGILRGEIDLLKRGANHSDDVWKPRYLWFPSDNLNEYKLRKGNPPARDDRPMKLRGIDLVVDVAEPGDRLRGLARDAGLDLYSLAEIRKAVVQEEMEGQERLVQPVEGMWL